MSISVHCSVDMCRNRVSDRVYLGRGTLRGTLSCFSLFYKAFCL